MEKFEEEYDEEEPDFESMSGCEQGEWFDDFFEKYTNDEYLFEPSKNYLKDGEFLLEMVNYFNNWYAEDYGMREVKINLSLEEVYTNYLYVYCRDERDKILELIDPIIQSRTAILK